MRNMNQIKERGINTYFSHVYGGKRKQMNIQNNKYPRNPKFSMNNKKVIKSRYSPVTSKITRKIIMLFICSMILTLMMAQLNKDRDSYFVTTGIILIAGFMVVPFFYVMVKSYYIYILYFIIITILGMLGYGWGLFSVLINITPGIKATEN